MMQELDVDEMATGRYWCVEEEVLKNDHFSFDNDMIIWAIIF